MELSPPSRSGNRGTPLASLLLLLFISLPAANSLGSMSGLALTSTAALVCGITPGDSRIKCWNPQAQQSNALNPSTATFFGLSGGSNYFCALRKWSMQPFCWDSSNLTSYRRISSNAYTQISVGESHLCGIRGSDQGVDCWRALSAELQTPPPGLQFSSITSGSNFTCGILLVNQTILCWGRGEIQQQLVPAQSPFSMIQAGFNHVCGLYSAFQAQTYCWGDNSFNQTDSPSGIQFSELALGETHSCGISRETRLVTCWGDNSTSQLAAPADTRFDSITAGARFTCGVTSGSLSVICWGEGFGNSSRLLPQLALPGICNSSTCGAERYQLVNSSSGARLCSTLTEHVCVFCTKCPEGASEVSPCTSNRDRQCSPAPPPPPPLLALPRRRSDKSLSNVEIVSIVLGSTGFLLGTAAVIACFWRKFSKKFEAECRIHHSANANNGSVTVSQQQQFRRQKSGASIAGSRRSLGRADAFSLHELALATDNFSEENRIGNGSFGSVYRGVLQDGREVAIKRGGIGSSNLDAIAKKRFQDKEAAFQSELEFLTRLHHRHLVTLVGFCAEDDERLLVYDFMPNGTVHDHLHGRKREEQTLTQPARALTPGSSGTLKSKSRNLNSWQSRVTVALQAARGIDYLHTYAVPPIIHRDIKSSNILLDSDFSARVSDFGLSLMGPSDDESHLSMTAAGTVGYMDPEYYRLQHLTTKSDVYSFGVVLLELLTGKRAIIVENKAKLEDIQNKGQHLPVNVVDYAAPMIMEKQVLQILDPRLRVPEPGSDEIQAVFLVAELAEQCVRLEGKERPSMAEIVGTLENAISILSQSDSDRRRKKKMKLLQQLNLSRSRSNTDSSGEIREMAAPRD